MARRLGLPLRTWCNYEEGTAIPAEIVLSLIELTSVEPQWLLYGKEPKYRLKKCQEDDDRPPPRIKACALLREALGLLERGRSAESATARRCG
jgi:hypothetical protein